MRFCLSSEHSWAVRVSPVYHVHLEEFVQAEWSVGICELCRRQPGLKSQLTSCVTLSNLLNALSLFPSLLKGNNSHLSHWVSVRVYLFMQEPGTCSMLSNVLSKRELPRCVVIVGIVGALL